MRRGRARAVRSRPRVAGLLALCAALSSGTVSAQESALVVDLSQETVAITTGFAGTDVILFGAIEDSGDVVVIVRGPDRPVVMRRKSRVLGVWINTGKMTFDRAPSFYAVASSRPLAEVAQETVLSREQMGLDNLRLDLPRAKASANVAAEWRAGLVRNHQRLGLYQSEIRPITVQFDRLFRAELSLPANVPTGKYQVQVYLLRDGRVVSAQIRGLDVERVGTEALVYDFAYENSAFYGLIAILVALMAGWAAHMAFRKA